jgi:hypothetical protein
MHGPLNVKITWLNFESCVKKDGDRRLQTQGLKFLHISRVCLYETRRWPAVATETVV